MGSLEELLAEILNVCLKLASKESLEKFQGESQEFLFLEKSLKECLLILLEEFIESLITFVEESMPATLDNISDSSLETFLMASVKKILVGVRQGIPGSIIEEIFQETSS